MDFIIDTQILIWSVISPNKLSFKVREILENNNIGVSQISLYEIAIKQKIGKLSELDLSISDLINCLLKDGFEILSLKNSHIEAYERIQLIDTHRDPFDRLLLATSLSENIPIISADEKFKEYISQIQLIEN
jgi:PIN domain nuclease of toxin-antitoxin system